MSPHPIISKLHAIKAIQFGEFQLKSGEISSVYINLRKIISYPDLLKAIADLMWQSISKNSFDLVCGVPYTALPIATCLSLDHHIPMLMRRKEKKDYGTKQLIEGVFTEGQRCLVIEDIITTGTSILETTHDLESEGLMVEEVIALVARNQGGIATLEKKYRVKAIFSLNDMLLQLINSQTLSPTETKQAKLFLQLRSVAC